MICSYMSLVRPYGDAGAVWDFSVTKPSDGTPYTAVLDENKIRRTPVLSTDSSTAFFVARWTTPSARWRRRDSTTNGVSRTEPRKRGVSGLSVSRLPLERSSSNAPYAHYAVARRRHALRYSQPAGDQHSPVCSPSSETSPYGSAARSGDSFGHAA
jgi:hypothetical protein